MKLLALSVALLLCLTSATFANAEEELAPGFNACIERDDSTAGMMECLGKATNYWDKILNANYKKAMANCDSNECKANLKKAERLWIQYRDSMVDVVFQLNGGGSLSRVAASDFFATETKKQAQLLGQGD